MITTYQCNLRCPFCYQHVKDSVFLNPEALVKIFVDDPGKPSYITVMGGEVALNPDNTFAVIHMLRCLYPGVSLSVTTNGTGGLDFYKALQIDNLTVSMPTYDLRRATLLLQLQREASYSLRVNHYLSGQKIHHAVMSFCYNNDIGLTLCPPMEEGPLDPIKLVAESDFSLCGLKYEPIEVTKHYAIFKCVHSSYKFWIYNHTDNYDYDNLIVLPNGTTTEDFKDVIECKGAN